MVMKNLPKISISTPYRENSIVNIARAAQEHGVLIDFNTTLVLENWRRRFEKIPAIGAQVAQKMSRRVFDSISSQYVHGVSAGPELLQSGVRFLLGKRRQTLSVGLVYWSKAKFDARVASRLAETKPDIFIGMYGASLDSFEVVSRDGGLSVLNFVNSHPEEHNRYLRELGGVSATHQELIPDGLRRRVERELEAADVILVPSRFVARQLEGHGIQAEKIVTRHYGVDLQAFYPSLEKRSGANEMLECLYVGQMSHRKGVPLLLDVARRCKGLPVRFRLIGPLVSPEVLTDMPDNVTYEGPSLPGGVSAAMRRADIFVLPTLEDACALVTLEAMASGLPVITTENNGSGEVITNKSDGLIVPAGDVDSLVSSVTGLVEDASLRETYGDSARRKVQHEHSWETYGRGILRTAETMWASRRDNKMTGTVTGTR